MGWLDEQSKQRKQSDDQLFEEAFVRITDAVLGTKMSAAYQSDEAKASGEIGEILKYYKIKPREVPDTVKGLDDRLEYLLRPHGIMRRNVQLQKGWYKDAIGAQEQTECPNFVCVTTTFQVIKNRFFSCMTCGVWHNGEYVIGRVTD